MNRTAQGKISALLSHIFMVCRTSYHVATNHRYTLHYLGYKDNTCVTSNDAKCPEAILLLLLHTLSVGKSAITVEGRVPSGRVKVVYW
jgi:hypothetical protein